MARGPFWSDAERATLRRLRPTHTPQAVASELARTRRAIETEARRLGIGWGKLLPGPTRQAEPIPRARTCQFPFGGRPYSFCGCAVERGSYCLNHWLVTHTGVKAEAVAAGEVGGLMEATARVRRGGGSEAGKGET